MKIKTLFIFMLALVMGVALLQTSHRVHEHKADIAQLHADIRAEEEAIKVLEAEWAFLTRPERLEHLAQGYLGMGVPHADGLAADARAFPLYDRVSIQ